MVIAQYSRGAALAACLVMTPAIAESPNPQGDAPAQPEQQRAEPMPLTTDTVQYCFRLAAQIESSDSETDEMRHLVSEGLQMCSNGHVIGGLIRLRRAFVIQQGDTLQH